MHGFYCVVDYKPVSRDHVLVLVYPQLLVLGMCGLLNSSSAVSKKVYNDFPDD